MQTTPYQENIPSHDQKNNRANQNDSKIEVT